jgi:Spy/CpxP family protein refolding chaperone
MKRRRSQNRVLAPVALLALAALLVGPASAEANCDGPPRGPGGCSGHGAPGGWIEDNADRLGLDEPTTAAIRQIVEASRTENERLEREADLAFRELRALLDQDLPEESAVMAAIDKVGAVEVAMKKNRYGAMLRIRSLLSEEQRREMTRMREEWKARRPPH